MQFPVFIALFRVIRSPLSYLGYVATALASGHIRYAPGSGTGLLAELRGSSLASALFHHAEAVNRFVGIRLDCSAGLTLKGQGTPTVSSPCGHGVVSALPYLVLVLLMGLSTYYQQKQMQTSRGPMDPQAQQMQTFAKIMPAFLVVISFNFPAGLVLYWLTTNIWTIGQQAWMLRTVPAVPDSPSKASSSPEGPKARPRSPSKPDQRKGPSASKPLKPDPKQASEDGQKPGPPGTADKTRPSGKKRRKR
jgi:YidC/Oxa1 family membrane protein insertase